MGNGRTFCLTETVKHELLEQSSIGTDPAEGSIFIGLPKNQVQNSIAQSDQRVPMETSYRDTHNANSLLSPYPIQTGVCQQFWKAGIMMCDHLQKEHFKMAWIMFVFILNFFILNATSYKWALDAIAELLDNAVDEIQNRPCVSDRFLGSDILMYDMGAVFL